MRPEGGDLETVPHRAAQGMGEIGETGRSRGQALEVDEPGVGRERGDDVLEPQVGDDGHDSPNRTRHAGVVTQVYV